MKTTSLIILVVSILICLSTPLLSQTGTFTVHLPTLNSSNVDSIIVPNGRPIYALFVSGFGRNGNFDELHFYNFARKIMEHGGYVHYAWWNNLLAPYMERPLHDDQSFPGNLLRAFVNFIDPTLPKALPGEDYQFVADADSFLTTVRRHNPNAIIIVVGHSMGGGAIIHLANAWTTVENGRIDILAPIDPVGNRNWPWAGHTLVHSRSNASDFNWTRWRATRDNFLGYRRLTRVGGQCVPTGNWLDDYNVAKETSNLLCRLQEPDIHQAPTLTFGENVVHLYHRYQTEAKFPFDFSDEYDFVHNPPPGGSTSQAPIPMTPAFCGGGQRCDDPGGWPNITLAIDYACCPDIDGVGWPNDGHGEIVGYRGPVIDLPTEIKKPVPLGVRVSTSLNCGEQCLNKIWPWRFKENFLWNNDSSSSRVEILKNLENLSAGSTWGHRPYNPDLCLVSSGLISLFNSISSQWTLQTSGTFLNLRSVWFTDVNTGWAVGAVGIIKHTTDGGTTWSAQTSGTIRNLKAVHFNDASTGWVVGNVGVIKHTTDGGTTWTAQPSGTSRNLTAVYFIDASTGWVVGSSGLITHTTDGGATWAAQPSGTSSNFTGVHFTDASTGWVVGDLGAITHTTDGGTTWMAQPSGTSSNFTGVHFTDASTGWAVGDLGAITHTTDGGTTWNQQITGRSNRLDDVYFTDANTGWTVGSGGIILHTANGGVSFVEEEEIQEMPTDYNLSQNYPNPFNPSTKIRYSVLQSSNVVIKVFDILGNEIETLVDEEKPTGTFQITWNAQNLPSGIYFYRIYAGNYIETKKMVLLK
jgi:photosystem II stability/assembly factor-like uncharacterized protein/pimeloyl-ACP methyl ester carboxylesterase